ncbi:MAG TPA: hypothetical protein VFI31_22455 [Pirellulales bacterium]|nr:hypothetical protein [Pirellulales bacterium]
MRTARLRLLFFASLVLTGCHAHRTVPRGKFFLPEDSFLTVKRIEKLVKPGMPIEQAREIMEIHGFVCTYEEAIGIPHLQCDQIQRSRLWPFHGVWMATIYYEHGLVKSVQARFDENPVELGVCIPKHTAIEAIATGNAKDAHDRMHEEQAGVAPPASEGVVFGPDMPVQAVPLEEVPAPAATGAEIGPAGEPAEMP